MFDWFFEFVEGVGEGGMNTMEPLVFARSWHQQMRMRAGGGVQHSEMCASPEARIGRRECVGAWEGLILYRVGTSCVGVGRVVDLESFLFACFLCCWLLTGVAEGSLFRCIPTNIFTQLRILHTIRKCLVPPKFGRRFRVAT